MCLYRSLQGHAGDYESNCLLRPVDQGPLVPEADPDPGTQPRYDPEPKHLRPKAPSHVAYCSLSQGKPGLQGWVGPGSGPRSQEDEVKPWER